MPCQSTIHEAAAPDKVERPLGHAGAQCQSRHLMNPTLEAIAIVGIPVELLHYLTNRQKFESQSNPVLLINQSLSNQHLPFQ